MNWHDEVGGQRNHPPAFDGFIDYDCPDCGALTTQVCTREAEVFEDGQFKTIRTPRKSPCVGRPGTPADGGDER